MYLEEVEIVDIIKDSPQAKLGVVGADLDLLENFYVDSIQKFYCIFITLCLVFTNCISQTRCGFRVLTKLQYL